MHPVILSEHDGQMVSPKLGALLRDAYTALTLAPPNLTTARASLEKLLGFLCSPEGRTHANCVETDRFFFVRDKWAAGWEQLPEPWLDVLGDIGGQLHLAIVKAAVAENFDGLPEQLLERVRGLGGGELRAN